MKAKPQSNGLRFKWKKREKEQQQHPQSGAAAGKPEQEKESPQTESRDFSEAFRRLMDALVIALSVPVRMLTYLLNPPGSGVLFAVGAIYFLLVNIEGYFQSLPGNEAIAFMPKPFIDDGANLLYLPLLLIRPDFWLIALVSLLIQAIQTWSLKDRTPQEAFRAYEAVKDYRVPEKPTGKVLTLAEYRRQRIKGSGMKSVQKFGSIVLIAYLIDFAIAYANYPIIVSDLGQWIINLAWFILSIFGSELFLTLFLLALRTLLPPEKRFNPPTR